MQAKFFLSNLIFENTVYNDEMIHFGKRLTELRQAAGLSQNHLAAKLREPQSNISFWEKSQKPPRGEVLPDLARVLGVGVDELLGVSKLKSKQHAPKGRLQQVFAAASQLPRRQQQKVAEFVEAFVNQHNAHSH